MPLKPAGSVPGAVSGGTPDRERLLKELESPDPAVRRQAARALAGDQAAVGALSRRLGREDEVAVWDAILTSLVQTGGREALAELLGYLRAEPVQLRNEVLEALKSFPEEEIRPAAEKLLADPDPHLRIAVIQLIQALGHPAGGRLLARVLEREEHVNVAATAVDLLAEMGGPEDVPALEAARRRFAAVPFMAFAIDTALARIRRDGGG